MGDRATIVAPAIIIRSDDVLGVGTTQLCVAAQATPRLLQNRIATDPW